MSGSKIYTFASLSRGESLGIRVGGPGLGNLLFPWARSVAFAKKHGLPRISSTWRTVKIGPLLRGEFDKRAYSDLFDERQISGIEKFFLLNFGEKVKEEDALKALEVKSQRPKVILFEGMERLFKPILEDHAVIKEELLKMVFDHHKNAAERFKADGISVHIRMGDFSIPPSEEHLREGHWNYRLPLRWYISVIEKIRNAAGSSIPVYIFSDGSDEELKEILDLPNTEKVFFGSAIGDMLALSRSRVLVASASTFSMWASYLGRMPVIWYPGLHRMKLYLDTATFEGTLDYDENVPESLKTALIGPSTAT
ncbi:alpha-1,2-fucosyltransferase [Hydrogenimonas sp.]